MKKTCLSCGTELIKVAHESNARFEKKRFCSAKCSRVWMKANNVGWYNKERRNELFNDNPPIDS